MKLDMNFIDAMKRGGETWHLGYEMIEIAAKATYHEVSVEATNANSSTVEGRPFDVKSS